MLYHSRRLAYLRMILAAVEQQLAHAVGRVYAAQDVDGHPVRSPSRVRGGRREGGRDGVGERAREATGTVRSDS